MNKANFSYLVSFTKILESDDTHCQYLKINFAKVDRRDGNFDTSHLSFVITIVISITIHGWLSFLVSSQAIMLNQRNWRIEGSKTSKNPDLISDVDAVSRKMRRDFGFFFVIPVPFNYLRASPVISISIDVDYKGS